MEDFNGPSSFWNGFLALLKGLAFLLRPIFILLISIFLISWAGKNVLKVDDYLSLPKEEKSPALEKKSDSFPSPEDNFVPEDKSVFQSSFTDLFSSFARIDEERTNLHYDRVTSAFSFLPKFNWEKINNPNQEFAVSKKSCIANSCLKIGSAGEVYLDSRFLNLKKEIGLETDESLYVGNLSSLWALGRVSKNGDDFTGKVFLFDKEKFISVDPVIESKYEGQFGFGGEDNDFLVIYGASRGKAYRFQNQKLFEDISRFFDIRVMNGGFEASVLKSGESWYVFGLTDNRPKLIKLFQNGEKSISGIMDFSSENPISGSKLTVFSRNRFNSKKLFAKTISLDDKEEFWEFTDQGFDKSTPGEIVSKNINNYNAEVFKAVISELDFSDGGSEVQFFLSNDGENWQKVFPGKEIEFPNSHGRELRWRVSASPDKNSETTFFLDRIRVDYRIKFL